MKKDELFTDEENKLMQWLIDSELHYFDLSIAEYRAKGFEAPRTLHDHAAKLNAMRKKVVK